MDINQISQLKGEVGVSDLVKKARDDFRFVLSKSNILAPSNLQYQSIVKSGVTVGYALAAPFNVEDGECVIPAHLIKADDPKMYVALVCYRGGAPVDVLMFNSAYFAKAKKPIKYSKRGGQYEYVISIKDINHKSMQQHALGYVIGNL